MESFWGELMASGINQAAICVPCQLRETLRRMFVFDNIQEGTIDVPISIEHAVKIRATRLTHEMQQVKST